MTQSTLKIVDNESVNIGVKGEERKAVAKQLSTFRLLTFDAIYCLSASPAKIPPPESPSNSEPISTLSSSYSLAANN